MSVDLDHRLSGGQEKRRQIGVEPASVTVCNIIIFLCQHLGMVPEEGAYLLDKMSDPAYKPPPPPPPTLSTRAKVAKWGAYTCMWDTTV